ncbi:hypothetical protein DFH09DRAFT_1101317 [Mycena vulgaris]|nr:hypothetical protein DFH09DRAFT_1101317 [Mycena vulgaris]
MRLFALAENLTEAKCCLVDEHDDADIANASLRILIVTEGSLDILNSLILPSLQSLDICGMPDYESLWRFLERSSPPLLSLCGDGQRLDEWYKCLPLLGSNLENLEIRYVSRFVIGPLFSKNRKKNLSVLPNLKTLACCDVQHDSVDLRQLVAFLYSRSDKLRSFRLVWETSPFLDSEHCIPIGAGAIETVDSIIGHLSRLGQSGMDIYLGTETRNYARNEFPGREGSSEGSARAPLSGPGSAASSFFPGQALIALSAGCCARKRTTLFVPTWADCSCCPPLVSVPSGDYAYICLRACPDQDACQISSAQGNGWAVDLDARRPRLEGVTLTYSKPRITESTRNDLNEGTLIYPPYASFEKFLKKDDRWQRDIHCYRCVLILNTDDNFPYAKFDIETLAEFRDPYSLMDIQDPGANVLQEKHNTEARVQPCKAARSRPRPHPRVVPEPPCPVSASSSALDDAEDAPLPPPTASPLRRRGRIRLRHWGARARGRNGGALAGLGARARMEMTLAALAGGWGTRVAAQLASDVGGVTRRRHGGAAEAAQARRGQQGSRRRLVRLAPDDDVQLLLYVLVVFLGVVLQRGRRRADGELVCLRRGKRGPLRANGDADQREGAEAARRGGGDEAIDEGRTADERRDVGGCGSACVVEQAPTAETATPTPSLPSAMVQLLPDQIIDKPPSRCDKPGYFYDFLIVDDDDEDDEDALIIKYGRSADPVTRRKQWRRQCKGQHQRWQYCWEVPFATKFGFNSGAESLIHEHFKHAGAWLGPSKCNFCMVSHREKYDYRRCGGREGVNEVVVAYLRRLGWPVRVACKGSIRPNRRQKSRLSSRHAGDDQVLGRPPLKRVGLAAQIWRRRAGACRARRDARDYAERCACAARGGAPSAHVCDDDGDSFAVIAGSRTCTHIVPALLGGVEGSLHFFPYSIASQSAQPGADAAREMRTTLLSWRCARERTVFKKVSDALRPCATVPPHMTLVGRFCLAQYPCDYPKQLRLLMADNVTEDTAPSARPYRKTSVLIQALRREGILLEEYRETATCTTWSPWTSSPKFGPCLVAILSKFIPPSVSAPETLYVTLDVHVALWITAKFEQAKERVPTVQDLVNTALDLWSAQVLKHGEEAPWKNAEQLYSTIDSIQHGDAPWKVYKIRYQGQTGVVESFFGGLGTVLSIIKIEFPSFSDEKAMKDSTAEIIQNKSGWPVSCRAGVMRHRAPGASPPAPAPGASPSCPRPAHLGARARPAPGASLTLFTANIGRLYLEGKYHMCFHQK